MSLPPAVADYCNSEQQDRPRKNRWERIKRVLEVGGLLIALGLALLTYGTLQKISSQADSAHKQVDLMQLQQEATDRPWIKIVSAEPKSRLSFVGENSGDSIPGLHAMVDVIVVGKNIGKSVAVNLTIWGMLTFTRDEQRLKIEQKIACSSGALATWSSPVGTLFPDEDSGSKLLIQGGALLPEEASIIAAPKIVGCVAYSVSGSNYIHHSFFIFGLEKRIVRVGAITKLFGMVEPGTTFRPKDLLVIRDPYGFFAD